MRKPSNYSLKALFSASETHAFDNENPWFHDLKPMLSQIRSINFEKCKQNK